MVFGLSVLNRVYNFMRVCPKQDMVGTIVVVKSWPTHYLAVLYRGRLLVLKQLKIV